jgi:hypothetical protein
MSARNLLLAVVLLPLLHGCSAEKGPSDPSIVLDGEAPSPKVENGTAHDRAVLDLGAVTKVVLPAEATVRRGGEAGKVQLLMAKRLSFYGHPGHAMSVRVTRTGMGCATRNEGAAIVVAIHGEWDSGIEGGARVDLVAVVPDGVEVEQRAGLSKPLDATRAWVGLSLPAEGWTAAPDVPDTERSASK